MTALAEILSPGTATPVDTATADDDGMLTVGDLVRMFEESEDATNDARKDSERDRDYVDNKQHTAAELAALAKRGQPVQIDNRMKSKADYLVGLEKQQRIKPKALPRTPIHEQDAQGATEGLRYVAEVEDYNHKRSGVWRNMLVEGAGGISVSVEDGKGYGGKPKKVIKLSRVPWDRMFFDPHSSETDFSDAGYLGLVLWKNLDDALKEYPGKDAKDALETTMQSAPSDTYDDKPKFNHWADKKRKRVRVCQIWIKSGEDWHFAEFTKGGILKSGPSPYVTDTGESDCGLYFQAAYKDRDNNVYGLMREMVTLQDGINKRKSKSLHLLNTAQVWVDEDAIPASGLEKFRKEVHRPDGTIVLNPGSMANNKVKVERNIELAQAQVLLLQEDKNAIDLKGPNATQMGDKTQGSSAASGKAIIASQQGGMISLGDLSDNLRHLDMRVFRAVWARIRQFWREEDWIRVTDDERNIKWVGMNLPPERMQEMQMRAQQDPEFAKKIAGMMGPVAELDCDIIIDEVPDVIASQEQFKELVELKKYDVNNELPFRAIVQASQIKDKSKMLEEMDKQHAPNPLAQQAQQVELAEKAAQVKERTASAGLKGAQTQKTIVETQLLPQAQAHDVAMEHTQLAHDAMNQIHDRHSAEKDRAHGMLADHADRHQAAVFRGADMHEAEQAREFQGQQSEADRAAQEAAMQATLRAKQQQQRVPA